MKAEKPQRPEGRIQEFYFVPDECRPELGEGLQLGHIHHWRYWSRRLATICRCSDGILVAYLAGDGTVQRVVTTTKVLEEVLDFLPFNRAPEALVKAA